MAQSSGPASRRPSQHRAIRLTFAYRGQELRLVDRQEVAMRTLPSHELQASERQSGFWFQVEDSNGRLLYRRVLHNPIRFDTETPSDDPERPLTRLPLIEPEGIFYLLVPLLHDAKIVRLFSSPLESGREAEPAREILALNIYGGTGPEPPPTGTQPGGKPRRRRRSQSDQESEGDEGQSSAGGEAQGSEEA